ncbi:ArsR family transcriptional regulator [Tichowtungia aerotolerans]|uniref:Metalloregulator ArsR/SmtB family transcription factor n=1 Tax=Tichowtungia aerotolerans TaxID=2697043 RepID=A0A6P1MBJ2_9BACT|nr:metalloregulator ArsR/SmtB family transcription factor [Tichowtungia aerotolerans]QHI68936.1 metalloregulator ArsR/SmtB family transcription factor [Tichowtungia aerotolerans]
MNPCPTLWKTCRVIANETRLQLLWLLFSKGELTVTQIVTETGMSQPNASNQLKALRETGLIVCRRNKMKVFYRAEANPAAAVVPDILEALRDCYEKSVALKTLIRHATAFTHERRIEIFRALHGTSLTAPALRDATGMSPSALWRHLEKLVRRGYVKEADHAYRIGGAGNTLGRTLLKLAVH